MKHTVILVGALVLGACGSMRSPLTAPTASSSLQVASARVACTGVAETTCLQVRASADLPWRLFHGEIAGFDYEPGFLYELLVETQTVANPPADASTLRVTLVAVISKTAVGESLAGTTWQLTSIDGTGVIPGSRVTAAFGDQDLISGSAGCNRYTGKATARGGRIEVGLLASTRMYCADTMSQENAYFAALGEARSYRVAGSQLYVATSAGKETLTFERQ